MRLEQWGAGKEHYRMASKYPEYVLGIKLCKRNFTCFYLICKSRLIDITTTFAVISWKKGGIQNYDS